MITWQQAAGIALVLMVFPGTAPSQEQSAPSVTASKQAVEQQGTKSDIAAAAPAMAASSDEPSSYTIKKGDTLWDISSARLKDPFLWPFIWKANPSITNPDLILAGQSLTIPSLGQVERALQASPVEAPAETRVAEKEPVKTASPAPQSAPAAVEERIEAAPAPAPVSAAPIPQPETSRRAVAEPEQATGPQTHLIMPDEQKLPLVDKYALLSVGYISTEEKGDSIIGSAEASQTIFAFGQSVYVSIENSDTVRIGDKYLIYAPQHKVKHPKTGQSYGKLIRGLGILQITAKNSPAQFSARITLSFDAIEKGNLITPYQEPATIYSATKNKSKDISGYILEVTDRRSINAQTDFVYLDIGSADGVQAGDRFLVYSEKDQKRFPEHIIGELLVMTVKESTSTAFVRKSTDTMSRGNVVVYKK